MYTTHHMDNIQTKRKLFVDIFQINSRKVWLCVSC